MKIQFDTATVDVRRENMSIAIDVLHDGGNRVYFHIDAAEARVLATALVEAAKQVKGR